MDQVMQLVSAALVIVMAHAHVRTVSLGGPHRDRREVLEARIGQHLRFVDGGGSRQLQGLVRRVDRRAVAVRVVGSEVSVPLSAIDEVWQGKQLLARW
jgi:hypothetical protein